MLLSNHKTGIPLALLSFGKGAYPSVKIIILTGGVSCIYLCTYLKIISKSGIPWTIDGEFGGRKKQVEINNINMAIEYVIPM